MKAKKISHRTAKIEKPGRIGTTTLFTSPSDRRFQESRSLLARREDLEVYAAALVRGAFASARSGSDDLSTLFLMEAEDVAEVIRAVGLSLAGHATDDPWRPEIPDGESWFISSRAGLVKHAYAWEYPNRFMGPRGDPIRAAEHFEFGAGNALIRTSLLDRDSGERHTQSALLREADDTRAITTAEVLGCVSLVLAAFEPLRLTLTGDANSQVLNHLAKVRAKASELSRMLRHPHARVMMLRRWEAGAVLNEMLAVDAGKVEELLQGRKKLRAREMVMEQLVPCFHILFGRRPTADSSLSNSPFIRFGTKMFDILGCPCSPTTVGTTFRSWQRSHRIRGE
jgi:hypothetical protein